MSKSKEVNMETTVKANDYNSWLDCVWTALLGFREDCIPEGDENYDKQWSEITTSMAFIEEELNQA